MIIELPWHVFVHLVQLPPEFFHDLRRPVKFLIFLQTNISQDKISQFQSVIIFYKKIAINFTLTLSGLICSANLSLTVLFLSFLTGGSVPRGPKIFSTVGVLRNHFETLRPSATQFNSISTGPSSSSSGSACGSSDNNSFIYRNFSEISPMSVQFIIFGLITLLLVVMRKL